MHFLLPPKRKCQRKGRPWVLGDPLVAWTLSQQSRSDALFHFIYWLQSFFTSAAGFPIVIGTGSSPSGYPAFEPYGQFKPGAIKHNKNLIFENHISGRISDLVQCGHGEPKVRQDPDAGGKRWAQSRCGYEARPAWGQKGYNSWCATCNNVMVIYSTSRFYNTNPFNVEISFWVLQSKTIITWPVPPSPVVAASLLL